MPPQRLLGQSQGLVSGGADRSAGRKVELSDLDRMYATAPPQNGLKARGGDVSRRRLGASGHAASKAHRMYASSDGQQQGSKSRGLHLMLASTGRLLRYYPDTDSTQVLSEGKVGRLPMQGRLLI